MEEWYIEFQYNRCSVYHVIDSKMNLNVIISVKVKQNISVHGWIKVTARMDTFVILKHTGCIPNPLSLVT